jgi:hypothetical protein
MNTRTAKLILAAVLAGLALLSFSGCGTISNPLQDGATIVEITTHEDGRTDYRYRSPKDIDLTIPTEDGDIRAKSTTSQALAESTTASNAAAAKANAENAAAGFRLLEQVADKFPGPTP